MSTGLKIFALYDKKVSIYRFPHFSQNIPDALRGLQRALRDPGDISEYPEDFDLFQIGTFDEVTGNIIAVQPPFYVEAANNLIKKDTKDAGKKTI